MKHSVAIMAVALGMMIAPPASGRDNDGEGPAGVLPFVGIAIGVGFAGGAALLFPAIAKAQEPDLPYWLGVAFTACGSVPGLAAAYAVTRDGAEDDVLWAPALNAVGTGLLAAIIWAAVDQRRVAPPSSDYAHR